MPSIRVKGKLSGASPGGGGGEGLREGWGHLELTVALLFSTVSGVFYDSRSKH